jgi:D-alanyl-D-alanine carboxypeptidase/D-alanyl-D-alanine-endopeptidase (penicillin-binding protein 4)
MNWPSRACATAILAGTLAACHAAPRPAIAPAAAPLPPVLRLQQDIDRILAAPDLERSYWGVLVRSLGTGDTLYAVNAGRLMMPASNMKIVTLAVAADRLGWDYAFETQLFGAGPIKGGVLDGDLMAVGSGDPTIGREEAGTAVFDAWAERLKTLGIHAVGGRLIGNDDAFDDEKLGLGWAWDYLAEGYAAGVGALQYNENVVSITMTPSSAVGIPPTITVSPQGSGLEIRNTLATTPAGGAASITVRRLPGSARLEVRGSIPVGSPPVVRIVSVDNPTLFFASALRAALIARGIEVRGPAVDIDDLADPSSRPEGVLLASHRSPPLSALAIRMMKLSQNLYAESLVRAMGAANGTATINGGRATIGSIVESWGIPPNSLQMADGSGLSRYNLVTPEALVAILTHVHRDDRLREPFEAALPVAGRDGTLADRMKGTPADNNVRAKSGTISNVRSLSGYVRTADGEPLVFSILANNFDTSAEVIDRATDAIVVRLAEFRRQR